MPTKKILDFEPIPGGNPDRPQRRGKTRKCTGCHKGAEYKQGLCEPCWDEHVSEIGKEPTEDNWNEAFERAKNT